MKNQNFSNRYQEKFLVNGGTIVRTLPAGGKLTKLWVVLRGTLTITDPGGGAVGAARYPEHNLIGLLKRIRVVVTKAEGSRYPDGKLVDLNPRVLLRRAMFFRQKFISELRGVNPTGAAAVTANLYMAIPIYFAQPDLKRPIETALNADLAAYKNIQVEVDCGNRDTTFSGNTMTWDLSGLTVDFVDERENVDGDTHVIVQRDHETLIPGASTRFEDKQQVPDGALLDVLLLTQHGTNATTVALADDILNRVVLAGANMDLDLYRDDIHQTMYDFNMLDPAQAIVGIYLLNFVRDGMLSKIVPAAGLDVKYDVLNPSGTNNDSLLVATRQMFDPVGYTPIVRNVAAKNAA